MSTETLSSETTDRKILSNQEGSFEAQKRFNNVEDLQTRYDEAKIRQREDARPWENYLKSYRRMSKLNKKTGNIDPNWGQFAARIDQKIEKFESLVVDRKIWARIEPNDLQGEEKRRVSDIISHLFQIYCIDKWDERDEDIRSNLFDMMMFSKGVDVWKAKHGVYPENVPISRAFPDKNAGLNPKKWDLLFVEKEYTPVELYDEVHNQEKARMNGWNRKNVLELLRRISDTISTFDNGDVEEFFDSGKPNGGIGDISVKIVFAYVKEYKRKNKEKRITMYAFLDHDRIDNKRVDEVWSNDDNKDRDPVGFLAYDEAYAENFSQIVSVTSYRHSRSYYNMVSDAELVYAACLFYDNGVNRAIRAVMRNLTLLLKSDNQDQQNKLKNLGDDECIVLDPDTEAVQVRFQQDVKGLIEMVRMVVIDTDSQNGFGLVTGSQNVKGRPITAKESEIQLTERNESNRHEIRLFVKQEKRKLEEMYRRFCDDSLVLEDDEGSKNQKRFLKALKEAGIDKETYKDVTIYPVFYHLGDPPSVLIEKANIRLNALRARANATTMGEQRTIDDIVASTTSYADMEYYVDKDEDYKMLPMIKAGIENEIMTDPYLNRKNVFVSNEDRHWIEIPLHVQDAEYRVNVAIGLIEMLPQTSEENIPIKLDEATDIVIAIDNLMAHIRAHLMLSGQDPTMSPEAIKGVEKQLNEIAQKERAVEMQLSMIQQSRVQSNRERLVNDEKLRHMQQENMEKERHAVESHKIDTAKSLSKFQFALDSMERKHEQDIKNKQQMQSVELASKLATKATESTETQPSSTSKPTSTK